MIISHLQNFFKNYYLFFSSRPVFLLEFCSKPEKSSHKALNYHLDCTWRLPGKLFPSASQQVQTWMRVHYYNDNWAVVGNMLLRYLVSALPWNTAGSQQLLTSNLECLSIKHTWKHFFPGYLHNWYIILSSCKLFSFSESTNELNSELGLYL